VKIAVVADAHLGGPGGAAEPLLEQLRGLMRSGCERLVVLGDLFHVWVGDQRYETPEISAMVGTLRALRRSGVWVGYVEGNRDFFLGESPYRDAFDELGRELAFRHRGVRCLFVHGDGLNQRDVRYLFWRWLSKSAPSRLLFRRLPGPLARSIVARTERRLGRTNFRHKSRIPDMVISRSAARRMREGYDLLLLGHFHEERRYPVPGGEARIVDAWFRDPRLRSLDELLPAPASGAVGVAPVAVES
jgi:UDP-2,3-diacylglucosamine pyrophosphatase LpxH